MFEKIIGEKQEKKSILAPDKARIILIISKEQKEKLKELAKKLGYVSLSELIRDLIKNNLKNFENKIETCPK